MPLSVKTNALGEIGFQTINVLASVRRSCAELQTASATGPIMLSQLNDAVVALQRRVAELDTLQAQIGPGDKQALRSWATANLFNPNGTPYAGDFVANAVAGRNAVNGFLDLGAGALSRAPKP